MYCPEIWPEDSQDIEQKKKKKCVRDFPYFIIDLPQWHSS